MGIDRDASKSGTKRGKKPLEAPGGRYFALPHAVLDSDAWKACSPAARALLMELCRQHTGANNGRLHLTRSWLEPRGWKSPPVTNRLRDELIRLRLVVKTKDGGLNNGPHQFALTWLPVSNFTGLDITARDFHPGGYLLKPLPEAAKKQKGCNPYVRADPSPRNPSVQAGDSARNTSVRETAHFDDSARNTSVHNECLPLPREQRGRSVQYARMTAKPMPARMTATRLH